jgi:hypothetical protein
MRSRVALVALLATAIATVLLFTAAGSAPAARSCGTLRNHVHTQTFRYTVKVTTGSVSCTTARTVLGRFIRAHGRTRGWACRNVGQGTSCHDASSRKVIRAYYRGTTGDESP